jgi:carbon-monoxide dehydrogenase small subunit
LSEHKGVKLMPLKTYIQTSINGEPVDFLCEPRQSLLECLRDEIGLTGTKEGCNDGNCGACTVEMDGRIVTSCLVLGVECQGADIETIEGVAHGSNLHPIQEAFLENAALQCGICTPGFIIASKALLEKNPDPTEHEIRFWLANNLCRCTGYDKIVRAVQDAAKRMREA